MNEYVIRSLIGRRLMYGTETLWKENILLLFVNVEFYSAIEKILELLFDSWLNIMWK